ncbi:hypothetical protein [Paenibacillus guangzhouensis]|uniref:hypothetical protein n=1 Tax=Paenibacillus guangzhouensis TaxID=1473112 RepID=UPI00126724CF|nr:hypothetical protein [Paenibacillus guangzhouensis]
MREFRVLQILDRCRGYFTKLGVDYDVMRKILQVKLLMDRRRVPTVLTMMSKKKKQDDMLTETNYFGKSLFVYGFIGCLMVPFLMLGSQPMVQMSIIFSMMMFMMTSSMISDFSSVLLDVRDKSILSTKAVHPRTISMAKALHIVNYLVIITTVLMAPVWVVSIIRYGIVFGLIFLVEIILLDLLILVLTALVYFGVLRIFDGEKLKDMINYVQIGLSIGLVIGYQIVIRSFDLMQIDFDWVPAWWNLLLPPIWYAAPFALLTGMTNPYVIAMTVLAVCAPILAVAVYIRSLPKFEQHLMKLTYQGGDGKVAERRGLHVLAKVLCTSREEQAFFRFVMRMIGSEREFKLKVYPSLGVAFILPFVLLFNTLRSGGLAELSSSSMYYTIYFCLMVIPTCIAMAKFSGRHKGAWIYHVAPVQDVSAFHRALTKVVLLRMFIPVFLIQALVFIALFGSHIVPDLFVVVLSAIVYTSLCYKFMTKSLPFSEPIAESQQATGWGIMPYLLMIAPFTAIHYGSTMLAYGQYIYLAALIAVCLWIWTGGRSKGRQVNINA